MTAGKPQPNTSPIAKWHANNFDSHARGARQAEFLDAGTERHLALAWRNERDKSARDRLIESHMRVVVSTARGYPGYGIPHDELVSVGTIGLITAVDKYNPDNEGGARLSTYASHWIKSEITNHILANAYPTKPFTTQGARKAFFNVRSIKSAMGVGDRPLRESEIAAMASKLNIKPGEVREADAFFMSKPFVNIDTPLDGGDSATYANFIPSPHAGPERIISGRQILARVAAAFGTLSEREQDIFIARRLADEPRSLADLAAEYRVTGERIRQIENKALEKLQRGVAASGLEYAELDKKFSADRPRRGAKRAKPAPAVVSGP